MRIGIFGGSFSPIHNGHLNSLHEVAASESLDKIILVVAARPPHKSDQILFSAKDRFNMAKLATANDNLIEVSDLEIKRAGKSYTIDTMSHFVNSSNDQFFFILGIDTVREIKSWKDAMKLLTNYNFIVMTRAGIDSSGIIEYINVDSFISDNSLQKMGSELGTKSKFQIPCSGEYGGSIKVVNVSRLDISSTAICQKLEKQESVRYLSPLSVVEYIETKIIKNKN
ncbi:MAG: nicotinate-nucleotide adenylyltransferase [Nitrospinota bacterium]